LKFVHLGLRHDDLFRTLKVGGYGVNEHKVLRSLPGTVDDLLRSIQRYASVQV
jgi:hypothetical protein